MKPYLKQIIQECGEPLVGLDDRFAFALPHSYIMLGAPYGAVSPWMLRSGVLGSLQQASAILSQIRPGWKLKLYDCYRPNEVQAFMVWREFNEQAKICGISLADYSNPTDLESKCPTIYAELAPKVFQFWGIPNEDLATPPPHSTGAALDITMQDEFGMEIDMGCPVDELSPRAMPNYYFEGKTKLELEFHANRTLLYEVMAEAGFRQHQGEWWHFSLGDQMWAWLGGGTETAIYGRAFI